MRITVVGSGAVGGLLGAHLSGAGLDVTMFDVNRSLVQAVAAKGITVEMPSGDKKTYKVKITDDASTLNETDLIIICVKAYHTEEAMNKCLPLVSNQTLVMSAQNGLGNVETIVKMLGDPGRVIGATLKSNVLPLSEGHLLYGKGEDLILGPVDNEIRSVHEDIAAAFEKSGMQAKVTDNIQGALWTKASHNVMNALAAVLWLLNEEYLIYPSAVKVWEKAVQEAAAVAAAQGILIEDPDDPCSSPRRVYKMWQEAGSKGKTTTMQDLELGRRTEVEYINGVIVEAGKKLNIPTPVNEVLTLLVKALEEKRGI